MVEENSPKNKENKKSFLIWRPQYNQNKLKLVEEIKNL